MKNIIIIPARFASTRFPGKPLADIGGRPMIVRVAGRVADCADKVVVATDDTRIADACSRYGISAIMTREDHKSGTDRIFEAYSKIAEKYGHYDVVINVQGDEPFINPDHIRLLQSFFEDPSVDIATLSTPFPEDRPFRELADPNLVKLTTDLNQNALYFSRNVIPYLRGIPETEWPEKHRFLTHIGIYAYRPNVLQRITSLPQSPLEKCESLEQLRWLENGLKIKVGIVNETSIGIDTPEDLQNAMKRHLF